MTAARVQEQVNFFTYKYKIMTRMITKNLLCFISFLLLIVSCKKESTLLEMDSSVGLDQSIILTEESKRIHFSGMSLLTKLSQIKNQDDRKLSYSTLTGNQRYAVWKSKFAYAVGKEFYSDEQKMHIRTLYENLIPEHFEEGDEREIFFNGFMYKWLNEASELFESVEIYDLVFNLELDQPNNLERGSNKHGFASTAGSETNCHCSIASAYTCGRWNGEFLPPGLEWGICVAPNDCAASLKGCGPLLDLECTGSQCIY